MVEPDLRHNRIAGLILVVLTATVLEAFPSRAAGPTSVPDPSLAPALDPKTTAAHGVVTEIIDLVLAELSNEEVEQPAKVKAIELIVFNNFDFRTISRLVLARNYKRFSKDQRRDFEEQFKYYLSRFYGSRLVGYADESVEVRGARLEKRGDVTVTTRVVGGDVDGIEMNYRVRNRNDTWKIIDVTIEGVSTVSNFRSQFREIIRQGGPDELLNMLRQKTSEDAAADS